MSRYFDFVLKGVDGTPNYEFVETEDDQGVSVRLGEWVERDDGLSAIRIPSSAVGEPLPVQVVDLEAAADILAELSAVGAPQYAQAIDFEAATDMLAELRKNKVIMVDATHSARRIVEVALIGDPLFRKVPSRASDVDHVCGDTGCYRLVQVWPEVRE